MALTTANQTTKIYCDTCIFLDFLGGRSDSLRPLDEFAHQIFRRVKAGEFQLVVSDWVMFEVQKHIKKEQFDDFLKSFSIGQIIHIFKNSNDIIRARSISPEHYHDALHAILANKAGAEYLLTRDVGGFVGCGHLVKVRFPENI